MDSHVLGLVHSTEKHVYQGLCQVLRIPHPSLSPNLGAIHYAKVARLFASQRFQPFPNLPIFERKNAGFGEIGVMDRILEGYGSVGQSLILHAFSNESALFQCLDDRAIAQHGRSSTWSRLNVITREIVAGSDNQKCMQAHQT